MSEANDRADALRTVLGKQQIEAQIAELIAEAHRLGDLLGDVGHVLYSRPQNLSSEEALKNRCMQEIDGNRIVTLSSDLRELLVRLDQLAREDTSMKASFR